MLLEKSVELVRGGRLGDRRRTRAYIKAFEILTSGVDFSIRVSKMTMCLFPPGITPKK